MSSQDDQVKQSEEYELCDPRRWGLPLPVALVPACEYCATIFSKTGNESYIGDCRVCDRSICHSCLGQQLHSGKKWEFECEECFWRTLEDGNPHVKYFLPPYSGGGSGPSGGSDPGPAGGPSTGGSSTGNQVGGSSSQSTDKSQSQKGQSNQYQPSKDEKTMSGQKDVESLCGIDLLDIFTLVEDEMTQNNNDEQLSELELQWIKQQPTTSDAGKEFQAFQDDVSIKSCTSKSSSSDELIPTLSDVVYCDECGLQGDIMCLECHAVLCGNPMCTMSHTCKTGIGHGIHVHRCTLPPEGRFPLEVENGPTLKQSTVRLVVHPESGQVVHAKSLKGISTFEQAITVGLAEPLILPVPPNEDLLVVTKYNEHLQTVRKPRKMSAVSGKSSVKQTSRQEDKKIKSKKSSEVQDEGIQVSDLQSSQPQSSERDFVQWETIDSFIFGAYRVVVYKSSQEKTTHFVCPPPTLVPVGHIFLRVTEVQSWVDDAVVIRERFR